MLRLAMVSQAVRRLTHRRRRAWFRDGRAHVEYRDVAAGDFARFAKQLVAHLEAHPDVDRVEIHRGTGRVVVRYDDVWLSEEQLLALVEAAEAAADVEPGAFTEDRGDHPADTEPLLQDAVHLAADVVGVGLAVAGQVLRVLPRPRMLEHSWIVSVARNFPQVRDGIEASIGPETAGLVLGVANTVAQGLSGNATTPLVDVAQRSLEVAAHLSRRAVWERREPELVATPAEPSTEADGGARPVPVPEGQVERYADEAWFASLGGVASSIAATSDLARSATAVVDLLPKAARLGRGAFVAQFVRVASSRGMVVLDPDALDLLDRVDAIVLDAAVLSDGDRLAPGAEALVAAAREVDLHVLAAADGEVVPGPLDLDRVVARNRGAVTETVRALQRDGRVVLVVAPDGPVMSPAADVLAGVARDAEPTPWDAHVLCGPDLADVLLLVRSCGRARAATRQSVRLALAGAGIGAGAALDGMRRRSRQRVTRVVDTATLFAIANGARLASSLDALPRTLGRQETAWHAFTVADVLDRLDSGRDGLPEAEAATRRAPVGAPDGAASLLARSIGEELVNPLTPVLVAGAGLSLVTGAAADAAMVATVVGLNAAIGGAQRFRAERAVAALDGHDPTAVRVRRRGRLEHVDPGLLVPGDVIELGPGETVPADARLVETRGLEIDQSALTGESLPVGKSARAVKADAVADRTSMVYAGTSVAAGEAVAVVVATGADTETRSGARIPGAFDGDGTGVEARLRRLTRSTIPLAAASGAGVAITGLLRGLPTRDIVDAGVGLAVASVPEGLPLLATGAQLAAARRLSTKSVLVRDPRAVEALGRVDVLCADKTGTLTEGTLRLTLVSDGVTDVGLPAGLDGLHRRVLLTARRATPVRDDERLAHPTDRAIAEGAHRNGLEREGDGAFDVLDEVPFEPGRGFHAVLAGTGHGRVLAVKGAPEVVLGRCSARAHPSDDTRQMDDDDRDRLRQEGERLLGAGLRVLAVAERRLDASEVGPGDVADLTFLGYVGMSDPARPAAAGAIEDLGIAGVDVVMLTGDHPETARGIATELGLDADALLTGGELDALTDADLDGLLPDVAVFARVTPTHKVRIVRALQRAGRTVAVTGDGANDAPAIRLADVGIALGRDATPAARDAADIILTDEHLEVIVDAIAEGRGLWESVRDAVAVLVGGNIGEILFTFLGTLLGRRPPLNARQLLLVNLLTDVAPAMAIAVRPPTDLSPRRLLHEGPEESLGEELTRVIAWRAAGTATGATAAYVAARLTGTAGRARTVGLVALVGGQLGQTISAGATDPRVLAAGVGSGAALAGIVQTPGLSRLAGSRPLGPFAWLIGLSGAAVGTAVGVAGPTVERYVGPYVERYVGPHVPSFASLARWVPGLEAGSDGEAGDHRAETRDRSGSSR